MNESDDEDLFAPQFLQNHIKAINEKSKISLASLLNEKNKESSIKKASEDILHLENQFRGKNVEVLSKLATCKVKPQ